MSRSLRIALSLMVSGGNEGGGRWEAMTDLRLHAEDGDDPFIELYFEEAPTKQPLVDPTMTLDVTQARILATMLLEAAEHAYGRKGEEAIS